MIIKLVNFLKRNFIILIINIKQKIGIKYSTRRLRSGVLLKVRNIDILCRGILRESFEAKTQQAIMSNIKEGMTVLDIGANIGYYTVQMADKVGSKGKVLAFEPNPVVLEQLQLNINLNNFDNVIVEKLALSSKNGFDEFCTPEEGKESHGSLKENITFELKKKFSVKTEKLDDVLDRLGISKVDFIKIDVEGAEKLIFDGATKLLSSKHKPIIIFEAAEHLCRPFGNRVFDVLNLLYSFGYYVEQFEYGMWMALPRVERG
ncbi:MAG: hypothetical protein A2Y40_05430 [Candidatus Margulisbacteria bacterium GWF2_35_9]|nr:MAG: hypothetical protein A2Y40_05430 [Candidatus Margulisbacteria bacterium GWF2_35_9]